MRCSAPTEFYLTLWSIHVKGKYTMHAYFHLFIWPYCWSWICFSILQDWKCFEIWMVFHALSGKWIILLHSLCFKKWKKSNHLHSLFCLQLHIGFCILAAVAPPIVFKGKSLTYVSFIYVLYFTYQYCSCLYSCYKETKYSNSFSLLRRWVSCFLSLVKNRSK